MIPGGYANTDTMIIIVSASSDVTGNGHRYAAFASDRSYWDAWSRAMRSADELERGLQRAIDAFRNAVSSKALEDLRKAITELETAHPRPAAVPPGPPPCSLAMSTHPRHEKPATGRLVPALERFNGPAMRACARQTVPARTRRKLRTWEKS